MPKILQLSPHVADLIAAGEVVERPASVVKELVENSIDAGATRITVEIQNGGMTLIRVTDDGCGMEREDARVAFLRHATSKLRDARGLAAIGTLGFRGEALAAISSVSRIRLLTGTRDDPEGTALMLEAGKELSCEPAASPGGTAIFVRDLFYNTPARMKFMKSDLAESSAVTSAVQRLALAHPEISFTLIRDGQEQLRTAGDGQLVSAVSAVLGRQTVKDMIPVSSHFESISLSGLVSLPITSRGSRSWQFFFVNGRCIRSAALSAALEDAYRNQLMTGRFPACVLTLTVPPESVDVNVHPAKTEVRFLFEQKVCDAVRYGVLSALSKAPGKKDVSFPPQRQTAAAQPAPEFYQQMTAPELRARTAEPKQAPVRAAQKPAAPAGKQTQLLRSAVALPESDSARSVSAMLHRTLAAKPVPEPLKPAPEPPEQESIPLPASAPYRVIGEALGTYLLVEEGNAILLIDQHAAHERILFERLKARPVQAMAQTLLTPIPAQLSREEAAALLENAELLQRCGYALSDFGDHTVLIREIPDFVDAADAEAALAEIAAELLGGKRADPDAMRDTLLHTVACKAAIKAGRRIEPAERDALIREVMTRDDLKYCPHGRPICIRLTDEALRRQFKRS